MSDNQESRLQNLISANSAPDPSDELRQRVQRMASQSTATASNRRWFQYKTRLAFVGLAGIVALVGVVFTPSIVAANTIGAVTHAVDNAKSVHFRMLDLRTNPPTVANESWYANGMWRLESLGYQEVWRNGIDLRYSQKTHLLERRSKPEGPFSHNTKGFTMSALLVGLTSPSGKSDMVKEALPDGTYRLQVDNKPVQERYIFIVDQKSDLPKSMDVYKPEGGQWTKKMSGKLEFNTDLQASLFEIKTMPGTKEVDLDQFKSDLKGQFKSTILTLQVGPKRSIEIKKIEANSRGHIFIVYKGSAGGFWDWLDMKDELGNRYVKADVGSQGNFRDRPLDREDTSGLHVQWWVPTVKYGEFHPHRVTLKLVHQKTIKGKRQGEFTMGAEVIVGSTSVEIKEPTCLDVPFYLSALPSELPGDPDSLLRGETYTLCLYFQSRWIDASGKPVDSAGISEYSKNSGYQRDMRALAEAYRLAKVEQVLYEKYAEESGQADYPSLATQDLYRLTRLLGKIQESEQYKRETLRMNPNLKKNLDQWEEYENRIGNFPSHPVDISKF